jgi:hypothetical protein
MLSIGRFATYETKLTRMDNAMNGVRHVCGCLLILCLSCMISCHGETPAERKAMLAKHINELIAAPLKNLGEDRRSVQSRLGAPSSLNTEQLSNRHNPAQTDQTHTLAYQGLIIRIYDVPSFKKEMLLTVRLTENRSGLLPELIGQSEKAIKDRFGNPAGVDGTVFRYIPVYNTDEPGEDVVKIQFSDSLVSSVEWIYYVD